ncbi:MAG: archaemetzincin [Microscillaceae bacterium]|nr:archaemetzincin [Microscillaceae bacterium]
MIKRIFLVIGLLACTGFVFWCFYPQYVNNRSVVIYQKLKTNPFSEPKVCLQPFLGLDTATVQEVKRAIEKYYAFEVEVLPTDKLPDHARTTNIPALKYYNPLPDRYRADTLLRFLKKNKPSDCTYCLGLTHKDISTTKTRNRKIKEPTWMYTDWGIFGLGLNPGPTCILSIYRLSRDTQNPDKIRTRLRKIALHELGHNLGLPHCPNPACFMRDAVETILTIDAAPEDLCEVCKKTVFLK